MPDCCDGTDPYCVYHKKKEVKTNHTFLKNEEILIMVISISILSLVMINHFNNMKLMDTQVSYAILLFIGMSGSLTIFVRTAIMTESNGCTNSQKQD